MTESILLVVAAFAPLGAALVVMALRPRGLAPGRIVTIGCGVAFGAAAALLVISGARSDGWAGDVGGLDLSVNRASALLLAAATATATVVASFARRNLDLDARSVRFFSLFGVLVTGSALVVIPGGDLALIVGWVGSSWALVGLVGHRNERAATATAQRHAAQALVAGDLALVAAVAVLANANNATSQEFAAILLVIAGASRSALVPFHRWLVSTLAAPTPVSALVHAGFVSGAGLLMIRFGSLILNSTLAVHLAFAAAIATVVVGIAAGVKRVDVKGKLAWSTVAQMGFMVLQCSVGALSSAVFHIIGHGMYKATMFLGAGDAISAGLRSKRRSTPLATPPARVRLAVSAGCATAAVVLGWWVLPPDVSDGGIALVVIFAWATAAHGVAGWLARGALPANRALGVGAAGAFAAVLVYLAGLRVIEAFLKPAFGGLDADAGVSVTTLLITLAVVVAIAAFVSRADLALTRRASATIATWSARAAHPGVAGTWPSWRPASSTPVAAASTEALSANTSSGVLRSQIRADVARGGAVIAPSWPLTSFVAVNPLGGLEQLGFDTATETASQLFGARTHLSLDEFRCDHDAGLTNLADLRFAIESHFVEACSLGPVKVNGREVSAAEIIEIDLLHGPSTPPVLGPRTALERVESRSGPLGGLIDATIVHSAAHFVASGSGTFQQQWLGDSTTVSALRKYLAADAQRWLANLGADPADVIARAFAITGIDDAARVAEIRGHLARLQGWAGYAKWRTGWAHSDESRPALGLIDLVAARAALEAALLLGRPATAEPTVPGETNPASLRSRVGEVAAVLSAGSTVDDAVGESIGRVLAHVTETARARAWLSAQERHVEHELLTMLDRVDPGAPQRLPNAQLVFCIDVRSEGLRRHIEATGAYETVGFAGFFGVAMAVRRLEWDRFEARCPVLVAPSARAVERPAPGPDGQAQAERLLSRDRFAAGAAAVHSTTKFGLGAPFVMAEAAGWIAGPLAAARTLLPSRLIGPSARSRRRATVIELVPSAEGGLDLDQRVYTAEAVLRTMGVTDRFAPLVVLCGHASDNINNPHATALDCGACAGASGQDNARVVARLLNEPDVRAGLRDRGITIPDSTHFAAGLHETVSDRVDLLDLDALPEQHRGVAAQLAIDLATAAGAQSAKRALHLPGPRQSVRDRGADWAQVRAEWGLARNTSFIIGPRSMTAGLDLGGRSFLHTYDADQDPDGKVLETIMTAPLVVAHWISSQYYFSTVDPEVFGAGDKVVHNISANTGVISGEHGDLRVGLPLQSTHCGPNRHHQPVRLLAVVQAPLERIERIIDEHAILTTLVGGSWIRLAGRSHPHERWSIRTPAGTWSAEPRPIDTTTSLETP